MTIQLKLNKTKNSVQLRYRTFLLLEKVLLDNIILDLINKLENVSITRIGWHPLRIYLFICSVFLHSLKKLLLPTHYVSGIILGDRDIKMEVYFLPSGSSWSGGKTQTDKQL